MSKTTGGNSSVSSCLGPEWPGLGITVGSSGKCPEASLPNAEETEDMQLFNLKQVPAPPGVEASRNVSSLKASFPTVAGESNSHQRSQHQAPPPPAPRGLVGECDQKPTAISQLLCGGGSGDSGMGNGQPASSSLLLEAAGVTAASSISNLWRSQPPPLSVSGKGLEGEYYVTIVFISHGHYPGHDFADLAFGNFTIGRGIVGKVRGLRGSDVHQSCWGVIWSMSII